MPGLRLPILLLTYLLIAGRGVPGFRLSRPAAALLGAVAMVTFGGLPLRAAYAAIDLDVIVFLLGVLLLTAFLELGGFFESVAAWVLGRARSLRTLLAAVVAVSGLLSALFVNDTICLVLTPLVLAIVRSLGVRATPFLLALALASNVGSAMTPTGNPQNMLIAVSSGIPFGRFVANLLLPSVGGLVIVFLTVAWVYRADLTAPPEPRARTPVPAALADRALIVKALIVFGGALAGWLSGLSLPLVSIAAAAVLLAVAGRDPAAAFAHVEWELLLFFAALFVVMRGVQDTHVVTDLTTAAAARLDGRATHDATVVSAAMLALSNLISNVPAVILWLPVVPHLPHAGRIWLVMAMSSTFAGNLTLLGSMANLIVAERADGRGEHLAFTSHLRVGVPVTLLTTAWGIVALCAATA